MRHICNQICFQAFIAHCVIHSPVQTASDVIHFFRQCLIFTADPVCVDLVAHIARCDFFDSFLYPFLHSRTVQHKPDCRPVRRGCQNSQRQTAPDNSRPLAQQKCRKQYRCSGRQRFCLKRFISKDQYRAQQTVFPERFPLKTFYKAGISRKKTSE